MIGYFDGASRGNPGEAGAGALLMDDNGNTLWETARYLGRKTNNEAEYNAAILLLKARGSAARRSSRSTATVNLSSVSSQSNGR